MSRLEPTVRAARDHIRGDREAAVILVEYGDYECPACGLAHGLLPRLLAQSQGRIALVFRNFPLSALQPHAESAAEAAEAAGAQGRCWGGLAARVRGRPGARRGAPGRPAQGAFPKETYR